MRDLSISTQGILDFVIGAWRFLRSPITLRLEAVSTDDLCVNKA